VVIVSSSAVAVGAVQCADHRSSSFLFFCNYESRAENSPPPPPPPSSTSCHSKFSYYDDNVLSVATRPPTSRHLKILGGSYYFECTCSCVLLGPLGEKSKLAVMRYPLQDLLPQTKRHFLASRRKRRWYDETRGTLRPEIKFKLFWEERRDACFLHFSKRAT